MEEEQGLRCIQVVSRLWVEVGEVLPEQGEWAAVGIVLTERGSGDRSGDWQGLRTGRCDWKFSS